MPEVTRKDLDSRLFGRWVSEAGADENTSGANTLEFLDDGSLTYTVVGHDKDQVMLLTFRTEDGYIVSDQPSAPREERTPYSFTEDGKLMVFFGGELATYVRAD